MNKTSWKFAFKCRKVKQGTVQINKLHLRVVDNYIFIFLQKLFTFPSLCPGEKSNSIKIQALMVESWWKV